MSKFPTNPPKEPCIDCDNGPCHMNCGPKIDKLEMSEGFKAAVARAKRRKKFKPYHFPGVRD